MRSRTITPPGVMCRQRSVPPLLLLLLLGLLAILTISQILVVHNGGPSEYHSMRRLQAELRQIDVSVRSLMALSLPDAKASQKRLTHAANERRFRKIFAQAAVITNQTIHDGVPGNGRGDPPENGRESVTRQPLVAPLCEAVPSNLVGRAILSLNHTHGVNDSEADILTRNPNILPGGCTRPARCTARHRVAIVIPYRGRHEHLVTLLSHLHPLLARQELDYRIIVVEQYGSATFNKARLMNIGYLEGLRLYPFQCFVFHDVDLVPEDDRNMYSCPPQPRHMSVAVDEMGYRLAYQELVGGVLSMRTEHFLLVNGFSNLYWGWGAEDDDMAYRILHVGLRISRPPQSVARYTMLKHTKRKPNDWRKRSKLLFSGTKRFHHDGLNSLQYTVINITARPLFTHILADLGPPPQGFS